MSNEVRNYQTKVDVLPWPPIRLPIISKSVTVPHIIDCMLSMQYTLPFFFFIYACLFSKIIKPMIG